MAKELLMRIHHGFIAALKVGAAVLILTLAACSGGTTVNPNPNGTRPTITNITPAQGAVGDRIVITGLNFGAIQGTNFVRLGPVVLTINSWTDTQIDATIAAGATSGIIEVVVDGLNSQSGTQAQFFIPDRPTGDPILNTLNPNFGRRGTDTVTLIGENFGDSATGQVLFTAQGGGTIQANVKTEDNAGVITPLWSETSVVVFVPATADSGPVTITTTEGTSNSLSFTALPAPTGFADPVITSVTSDDTNIGIGSVVHIVGDHFGAQQGGSTLTISGLNMTAPNWSEQQIDAIIPQGATSGPITLTVGGKTTVSDPVTIGNVPNITGIAPSQIKIGSSLDVFGAYFGATQGTGKLTVGGVDLTVDSWTDTHLHVNAVPPVSADANKNLTVQVTASNGLASNAFAATLFTTLKATVTVNPTAGVVDSTIFSFLVDVSGGSDDYSYQLISDKANDDQVEPSTTTNPITYEYETVQMGTSQQKTFDTAVIVKDIQTGETLTFDGPSVLVVAAGQPVVTQMATSDFNRGVAAPNDWMYITSGPDTLYHNFMFFQGETIFASALYQIIDQGNPVPRYERDEASHMADGNLPLPRAYRYNTALGNELAPGSLVRLEGANFGVTQGTVRLVVGTPNETIVAASDFVDWQDGFIIFRLPGNLSFNLTGKVQVSTAAGKNFTTADLLYCSAYINTVTPATNVDPGGTVAFGGFDLLPAAKTDEVGDNIYFYWVINATYTNPFTAQSETGPALVVHPMAPDTVTPNLLSFDMRRLDNVEVEVYNLSQTASAVVPATQAGNSVYYAFLWTGAITPFSRPANIVAQSGLLSQAVRVNVGAGGGGPVVASLSANPTTASALGGPPIRFDFSAIGGTGTYTDFSIDFIEAGAPPFSSPTAGNTMYTFQNPSGPGGYDVLLTVTDSLGATDTATVNVVITP
jgi:hypothetical protein